MYNSCFSYFSNQYSLFSVFMKDTFYGRNKSILCAVEPCQVTMASARLSVLPPR